MGKVRRKFSEEAKRQAVEDYVSGRKSAVQVATEHGIAPGVIYKWKAQLEHSGQSAQTDSLVEGGLSVEQAKRFQQLEDELGEYKRKVAELTVVNDLLKKLRGMPSLSPRERVEWVNRHYPVLQSKKRARKMMQLTSSSYYYKPKISRAQKECKEADLRDAVERIRVEQPRLGYRMLLEHLKREGIRIGERRLRRILQKFGLQIRPRKRFVKTTDSNHTLEVHPNLIVGMTLDGINQVWASDITYVRIENGFVYVAVVLDLYSRKVIGWQISKTIDGQLTLDALKMAIARRNPPRGVIHHSDRGVQYLCEDYATCLKEHGLHISCSAKGNPYENAFLESFMKTLKDNEVYLWEYETILDVYEHVPPFLEEMYNRKRLHSSLGYLTPEEFEQRIEVENQNGSLPTLEL